MSSPDVCYVLQTAISIIYGVLPLSPNNLGLDVMLGESDRSDPGAAKRPPCAADLDQKLDHDPNMSFLGCKPKIPPYLALWLHFQRSHIIVIASVLHRKGTRRRTWCVHTEVFVKPWLLLLRYVYPMNSASRKFTSNS